MFNTNKKSNNKLVNRYYKHIGKHLIDIEKSYKEPVFIILLIERGKYQIISTESVRGKILKNKMEYSSDSDYDDDSPPKTWDRGIL